MSASHYKLDNPCAVVGRNRLQISGSIEDVMHHDDLKARFAAFGWHVIQADDYDALAAAFDEAGSTRGQPAVLIANTIKGYGSGIMENKADWHHHLPSQEEYEQIISDFAARKEAALHE